MHRNSAYTLTLLSLTIGGVWESHQEESLHKWNPGKIIERA